MYFHVCSDWVDGEKVFLKVSEGYRTYDEAIVRLANTMGVTHILSEEDDVIFPVYHTYAEEAA